MRIAIVAITLITSIAVVAVAILNGTGLLEGEIKPNPTPTPISSPTPTPTSPVTDLVSLIDNLREAGAIVDTKYVTQEPGFSVNVHVITVNGKYVHVFEYEDAAAADADAVSISAGSFSINCSTNNMTCQIVWSQPRWSGPPHFYKASNLIVLYGGHNQAVIDVLENILGPQFAGQ
jgi:hypothetical protein